MHHNHIRAGRMLAVAAVAATSALTLADAAPAAQAPSFSCRASAATVQIAGGAIDDPVRAGDDAARCGEAASGLPQLSESVGLGALASARTAYAITRPGGDVALRSEPSAEAGVEDLTVPGLPVGALSVGAARSSVRAVCTNGAPVYSGASEVARITLAGQPLVVDGVVQPVTDLLSDLLGGVVSVRLNEQVDLPGGGKAVRAARVRVLALDGSAAPLADVIVGESRLANTGAVCDPAALPPEGGSSSDGDSGGDEFRGLCPPGSALDVSRDVCVIAVPGSATERNPLGDLSGVGSVVVGKPFEGPKGGRVVTLQEARERFPADPCVRGPGLPYAVVGTARADRVTGTNGPDRILGVGGRDKLDGGRGDDCLSGGAGGDHLSGGQDDDRVHGGGGDDALNGNSGDDRLRAGAGDDTISSGYGADRAFGEAGDDAINVAVSGPAALAHGGPGRDTIRANPEDRVRAGERIFRVLPAPR